MPKDYSDEFKQYADYNPRLPVHVLLGEATEMAGLIRQYWKPQKDGAGNELPALETVSIRLPTESADEILELVDLAQKAIADHLLASQINLAPEKYLRADVLEKEIEDVLIFYFDDGVEDDNDAALAEVRNSPAMKSESVDAKALSLELLVALATPHRGALEGLGGFKTSYLAEAQALAKDLRAIESPSGPVSQRKREALQRRNACLGAIAARVDKARNAFRFVFRAHPAIASKATSRYERERRRKLERAKAAAAGSQSGDVGVA